MKKIIITTTMIQIDQLLKWIGLAASGGQAKQIINDHVIFINDNVVIERRKKIYPGDTLRIKDDQFLIVYDQDEHK